MLREQQRRERQSRESRASRDSVGSADSAEAVEQLPAGAEMSQERRHLLIQELQAEFCDFCRKGDLETCAAILDKDETKVPQVVDILGEKRRLDVDASSATGETPLLSAVDSGKLEMVQLILERGAQVNKHGKDGVSPLHSAAGFGRLKLTKYLLARGAHISQDAEGETPEDYARQFDFEDVVELFERLSAAHDETIEELKVETVPGYAEEKAKKVEAERLKREAAEKKIKDAEKERLRKERELRDTKELEARRQRPIAI